MNIIFAREVGLPKYFLRRAALAVRHCRGDGSSRLRLPTGGDIILPRDSFFGRDVYVTNADVDWGSEALLCKYLDASGDFVDVGANIGYYSAYAAPFVRRVFSFEPDARNHAPLAANAALAGNVRIHKVALSSEAGEATLDASKNSEVSRLTRDPDATGQKQTVAVQTLDGFARAHPDLRVSGLKIDTEGHELEILVGGRETIIRDQPLILAELMRWPGQGGENEFRALAEFAACLHYSIYGFTPSRPGFFRSGCFRLTHFDSVAVLSAHATKMVFLVPARLSVEFEAKSRRGIGTP